MQSKCPIAVVGVSALFPGATDITGFWHNIVAGRDEIREIPESYWLIDDFHDADPNAKDKTYGKRGAFVDPVDFDCLAHGVLPAQVQDTDTVQLMGLIVAQSVLRDAAKGDFAHLDRSRMSVILGCAGGTEQLVQMGARLQRPVWLKSLREAGVEENRAQAICERIADHYVPWSEASFPGLLGNVVAGRIANRFDLGGTNCVVDAACASSSSALTMAVQELYLGDSDAVLAGGADALNDILMYMCFSKTPALSASGDCRPFSDQADGTILGEGVGMVALRRLADAERDGDTIYGVIQGVGSSSDGSGTAVYAPVSEGQAQAIKRAYDSAGFDPGTVELIEAHGTGTKAGDKAEFNGLKLAFADSERSDRQWCAVGSVKSQIGHTKGAAGSASLIKAILALHHKVLPPTIKVDRPNPLFEIEHSPFYINTEARPWIRDERYPRRAGVSSFGFGGSNFHIALEEYQGKQSDPRRIMLADSHLLLWSADCVDTLFDSAHDSIAGLPDDAEALEYVARSSQLAFDARQHHRIALVSKSVAGAQQQLDNCRNAVGKTPDQAQSSPQGWYYGIGEHTGKTALLFPGQGSQYVNMGAQLSMTFPAAREIWDEAAGMALDENTTLPQRVFPPPVFSAEERKQLSADLNATEWAQPAIGASSLSQWALLHRMGLQVDGVAGHSFGELTALHVAGAFDRTTLLHLARKRGELMAEAAQAQAGAMSAVAADRATVQTLLDGLGDDLDPTPGQDQDNARAVIANVNSPRQIVISGAQTAIERAEQACRDQGLSCTRLPVATAFHSPIVAAALAPFSEHLQTTTFTPLQLPVYSNVSAQPYGEDSTEQKDCLGRQLASPVLFMDQLKAMHLDGFSTFIEVGPANVLTNLTSACLEDSPHTAIAIDRKKQGDVHSLWQALAQLSTLGATLDYAALWEGFREYPDPATRPQPKMAVPITGINYNRIYPPQGGASALPTANTSDTEARVVEKVVEKVIEVEKLVAVPAAAAPQTPDDSGPFDASRGIRDISPAPSPMVSAHQVAQPAPETTADAGPAAAWLAAFENIQRQTHEAHRQFLQLSETALGQLHQLLPGQTGSGRQHPAEAPARSAQQPAPAIVDSSTPVTQVIPSAQPIAASVVTAAAEPMAMASTTKNVAQAPAAEARATAEPSAPTPTTDVNAVMLDIVSEKTGYPLDMLTLDMDLEHDLGIDSIKRVEILSAAIERVPNLPELNPGDMAALRTLHEVTAFIGEQLGAAVAPSSPGNSAQATDAPPPGPGAITGITAGAAPHPDVNQLLLAIVAEKTGYPLDMLDPTMDLENDLGVDSIKRVEILSGAIEQVPDLPTLEPAAMADLRTLGEVAAYIGAQLSQADSTAAQTAPLSSTAGNATQTAGPSTSPSIDVEQLMLDVVAEKTGYPADMLEASMDLENDLGIDSIKRVEILAATTERVDNMPAVDAAEMASLRTLGDVASYIAGQLPAAAPAADAAVASTKPTNSKPAINVEQLMLDVVAEKTGYPADMLEASMDLENDLGIDSIKRVEILAATTERVDNMPAVDAAEMASLRTLGDVASYIAAQLGQTGTGSSKKSVSHPDHHDAAELSSTSVEPSANNAGAPGVRRYEVQLLALPAPGLCPEALRKADRMVVTPHNTAVAKALAAALSQRGIATELRAAPAADDRYVISLDGLKEMKTIAQATAANATVFGHACVIAAQQERHGGIFVVVQNTGGDYGLRQRKFNDIDAIRAFSGGLSGLAKTAAQEWPKALVRSIDLATEGHDAEQQAKAIVDELFNGAAQIEVGLSASGQRLVPIGSERSAQPGELPLNDDDVVVVSGGGRGVTAAALVALCREQPLRIALLGRTRLEETDAYHGIDGDKALMQAVLNKSKAEGQALSPPALKAAVAGILGQREIRQTLQEITATGAEVMYLDCDINSQPSLEDTLTRVRTQWGTIDALVHGAGVLADKLLSGKKPEHFQRVFGTKVDGLQHLLEATKADPLKLLCLFSSVAARAGNAGQSDYAMANEVLNRVAAVYQATSDAKVVSINWGPWESGMVNAALKQKFAEMGVALIPLADGAQRFVDELRHPAGQAVEVVIGGAALNRPLTQPDDRRRYEFSVSADPATLPHLDSHRVRGKVVLPVVQVVDWFSAAINSVAPSLQDTLISQLRVLKGVTLDDDQPQQLRVLVEEAATIGSFELSLVDTDGRKRYSACGRFSAASERREQPLNADHSAVDTGFDPYAERLFHGPLFAAVAQIEGMDAAGASARLNSAQQLDWQQADYQVDQALLDGALQLALLWGYEQTGNDTLPMSFAEMRIGHRGLQGKAARCTLQGTRNNASGTQSDLWIYDDDDEFVASIDGLEMYAVSESLQ